MNMILYQSKCVLVKKVCCLSKLHFCRGSMSGDFFFSTFKQNNCTISVLHVGLAMCSARKHQKGLKFSVGWKYSKAKTVNEMSQA